MSVVIEVEGLSKQYRLGQIGTGSLSDDLTRAWYRLRGKGDPFLKIGEYNDRTKPLGEVSDMQNANRVWALQDVSFKVSEGEVLGVVGRNGAGKSTLLKILSRVTAPSIGSVKMRGRLASLLEVGTGFHPDLSGKENIYLNGSILGMRKHEVTKKLNDIIEFSGCARYIDTPVKRYSSGMYVRLAFAVAAHLEPEILVVDEVLAVGDTEFQKKCIGKMGEVARGGRTVIFVSHSMAAVHALCTRAILFRNGRLHLDSDVPSVIGGYLADAAADQSGEFTLTEHSERSFCVQKIIRKVSILGAGDRKTSQLEPDELCAIEIDFELTTPARSLRWAIAIEDFMARRIMTFANYFEDTEFPILEGIGKVRCELGTLGLGSGRYLLSVSVADRTKMMLDSIDNVAWFEVEWSNGFPSGEPYNPVYGPVIRSSKWCVVGSTK